MHGGRCTGDFGAELQAVQQLHARGGLVVREVLVQVQSDVAVRDIDGVVRADHVENGA